SRNGILISDSRVLETLRKLDVIVLDKTGTITEGRFSLLHHEQLESNSVRVEQALAVGTSTSSSAIAQLETRTSITGAEEAIRLTASLEQYSEHPLGMAVVEFARHES